MPSWRQRKENPEIDRWLIAALTTDCRTGSAYSTISLHGVPDQSRQAKHMRTRVYYVATCLFQLQFVVCLPLLLTATWIKLHLLQHSMPRDDWPTERLSRHNHLLKLLQGLNQGNSLLLLQRLLSSFLLLLFLISLSCHAVQQT